MKQSTGCLNKCEYTLIKQSQIVTIICMDIFYLLYKAASSVHKSTTVTKNLS